ncbi:hypothetical protein G7046_g6229 [Stylonectria norvegica]|nr:hypothetical protein G7046_g6229 [Stylonectria norvegica]
MVDVPASKPSEMWNSAQLTHKSPQVAARDAMQVGKAVLALAFDSGNKAGGEKAGNLELSSHQPLLSGFMTSSKQNEQLTLDRDRFAFIQADTVRMETTSSIVFECRIAVAPKGRANHDGDTNGPNRWSQTFAASDNIPG